MELAHVDSRARTSRSHQVVKGSLARWIKILDQVKKEKKIFKKRFSRRLVSGFVSVKILFLDKM